MNSKTIKRILKGKFDRWVKSIKDEKVRSLVQGNTIITGGSIASLLMKEEVKDFDVYFRNKETVVAVANYYVDQFNTRNPDHKNKLGGNAKAYVLDGEFVAEFIKNTDFKNQGSVVSRMVANCPPDRVKVIVRSDGVAAEDEKILEEPFEDVYDVLEAADAIPAAELAKPEYRPVFLSTNAITLSDKVQLVIRFYGEPEDIHKNYDFVHCTNSWTSWDNKLTLRQEALESILAKELKYLGSKYPVCSIIRTRKFINRGWFINAGQYLKMAFQVSKLNLEDIDVMEDQLVGVDSAYFMVLIDALRKNHEQNKDLTLSNDYIATLVDKIF